MTPPQTSIFDIPHIVDAISNYLSSKDIWCCYRVSRTWSQVFNLQRYKSVRFIRLDPHQTSDILHNAHMIHNLTVDLRGASCLLDAHCTRLKNLVCTDAWYTGYRGIVPELTSSRESWGEPPGSTRSDLDLTSNALLLIYRNPDIEQLTVTRNPFSRDILTSLTIHQSLRKISFRLWITMGTVATILKHLPRTLHDLELDGTLEWDWDEDIPELDLTYPLQLQRFVWRMERCPWLEEISLGEVEAFGSVTRALAEHCPRLKSIGLKIVTNEELLFATDLVRAYPMGLRSFMLGSTKYYYPYEPYAGELIEALLAHSSHTLEVLQLYGELQGVVNDIRSVLEGFPNLIELQVPSVWFHLKDIVNRRNWTDRSVWETDPSTGTTGSSLTLPWACTKVETLSLFISEPLEWRFESFQEMFDFWERREGEEEAMSAACGLGILWNTLKSLKSLKTLSLHWGSDMNQKLRSMIFDRAVFYMKQIGLPQMTPQEAAWMGMRNWDSIGDFLKSQEAARSYLEKYTLLSGCMLYQEECQNGFYEHPSEWDCEYIKQHRDSLVHILVLATVPQGYLGLTGSGHSNE
ncbi:hypothetical protein BGX34_000652 [Mortierella sp. NVP85]|nr:hypothetical protein BGX34_000652 [Mortierella sp. NVP85]